MRTLADYRPLFHSEADFQHAFAWELQIGLPDASVRLERQILPGLHLDIAVVRDDHLTAFELKYATRALDHPVGDERYALRNHGAQDIRRYDVVKDVTRIERLVNENVAQNGFVVVLTNDSGYWLESQHPLTADNAFRIHHGRGIQGTMTWSPRAAPGTTKRRDKPLELKGQYIAEWHDYRQVVDGPRGTFRYLTIEVLGGSVAQRASTLEQ